jgi:hypothetical protein
VLFDGLAGPSFEVPLQKGRPAWDTKRRAAIALIGRDFVNRSAQFRFAGDAGLSV